MKCNLCEKGGCDVDLDVHAGEFEVKDETSIN